MKNETRSPRIQLTKSEVPTQLVEKLICKVQPNIHLFSAQPILKRLREPTRIQVRRYLVEHLADGTLYCKELGRTLPSTTQGRIDTEKLSREIASHSGFFQSR